MRTIDIIDRQTFKRKGVYPVANYKIETDLSSGGISTATVTKGNVQKGDFAIIRDNNTTVFCGIIKMGVNAGGAKEYKVTIGEMENLFAQNIILTHDYVIAEIGIEDFIATTIVNQFKSSGDIFTDMKYIKVVVNTHTVSLIKPTSNNNIFNLKDYLVLIRETDSVFLDYHFGNGELLIIIEKRELRPVLIDTSLSDISKYKESFTDNVLAKLVVIWKHGANYDQKKYYLIETGEISENSADPLRIQGNSDTVFIESNSLAAVYEEVGNKLKANAYEHSVEFNVSDSSKIIEKKNLYIGRLVRVMISDKRIFDSIITKVSTSSDSREVFVKLGKLNRILTEKLRRILN